MSNDKRMNEDGTVKPTRKSSKRGDFTCPMCDTPAVKISRNGADDPWRATCEACGCTWEYIQVHERGGVREVIASDGESVVSLGVTRVGIAK